jgi:hypothetical protein
MSFDELCICGDTYEVHFGGECTRIGRTGTPCDCKQFVSCEYSVQIFNALKYILDCAKLKHQTFELVQAFAIAETLIQNSTAPLPLDPPPPHPALPRKDKLMTEAEKSNERQVAYSRILELLRAMSGQVSRNRVVKLLLEISNNDDAWKKLPKP